MICANTDHHVNTLSTIKKEKKKKKKVVQREKKCSKLAEKFLSIWPKSLKLTSKIFEHIQQFSINLNIEPTLLYGSLEGPYLAAAFVFVAALLFSRK